TGRVVYHFHTRTKTGRAPALQMAAPEPTLQINAQDAKRLGVADGEVVEVASRRGTVRARAKLGGVGCGQVFLPFHYGYWDAGGGEHDRAANELTLTGWDPVSKQPYYKYAAVQVRKAGGALAGRVADAASKLVERGKELADKVLSSAHVERSHVADYLGLLDAAHRQFIEAC